MIINAREYLDTIESYVLWNMIINAYESLDTIESYVPAMKHDY